jgi:L-seryl-tRNA(Ser) seleniumtransferase
LKTLSQNNINNLYRAIPSVQEILQTPAFQRYPLHPPYLKRIVQEEIQKLRERVSQQKSMSAEKIPLALREQILSRLERLFTPGLRRVINASGIILHTNMGRAPLAESARSFLAAVVENYNNLEINLDSGKRGKRNTHVEEMLCLITGAEAAMVVNNCAAAILLVLNTLCNRREVPVSRGELVEIGGSFRMPDVMKSSGAKMVEIGTTNKTHLRDYQAAITPKTGALLRVHTSNYRIMGFTGKVEKADLVALAHRHGLPAIYDMGSGVIEDLQQWGYPHEPLAREMMEAGFDVVTFSGDKVLGGPQAGIIIGKKNWLDKIKKNHLARALRCDKLIYSALEATLRLYLQPDTLPQTLPVAAMLTLSQEELRRRGESLKDKLKNAFLKIEVVETYSQMGSGALPLEKIPSIALKITSPKISAIKLSAALRSFNPPIVGYVQDEALFLNLRTVREDELEIIQKALTELNESNRAKP